MVLNASGWGGRIAAQLACLMLVLQPFADLRAETPEKAPTAADVSHATQFDAADFDAAGGQSAPLAVADALDPGPAFTTEELETLVGPIALYPDPLLIQVLLAATYPLDIIRAHRFLQENPDVSPEELVDKAEAQGWDPSVISLVAFPTVLERMATELDWTAQLGEAMAIQSEDLLDAIQGLREQAQASGALQSNEYQTVAFEEGETISITPAEPEMIYVPQYQPEQVFVPASTSTTFVTQPATTTVVTQSGHSTEALVATGLIAFTAGILIGNYFGRRDRYDYYWGRPYSHVAWHHHSIYPPYYRPSGYRPPYYRPPPPGYRPGDAWRPRPELYRDAQVRVDRRREVNRNVNRNINRNVNVDVRDRTRPSTSGRAATMEQQLRERGRDRPGTARPTAPQRPAASDRVRPGTGDRAKAAARPSGRDTAFGDRARKNEVQKSRERGATSIDRAWKKEAAPARRPGRNDAEKRPQRPQAEQRPKGGQTPQAGQRPRSSSGVFERGGGDAAKSSNRGRSSAGAGRKSR